MQSFLVNAFIGLCQRIPLRYLHLFGVLVGNVIYYLPNNIRYVSLTNINVCFSSHNEKFRQRLLKNSLIELSKWFLELGPMWKWPPEALESLIISSEGEEAVIDCLNNQQGALIVTPHYGNWELAGLAGSLHFPLTIMYKPPGIAALGDHMHTARTRAGAKLVGIDRSALKSIITALKNGEAVGMLPDQEPKEGAFAVAPFFGVEARTMTLFNKLIRKTGAAIFIARMQRLPRGQGYAHKYVRLPDDLGSSDETVAVAALNRELEKIILECPEQYLWAYRRFKFRPTGHPAIYQH